MYMASSRAQNGAASAAGTLHPRGVRAKHGKALEVRVPGREAQRWPPPHTHTQGTGVAWLAHACGGWGIRLQKGRASLPDSGVSPTHWTSGHVDRGRAPNAGEGMGLLALAG